MTTKTRRDFLRMSAGSIGAAAMFGMLPATIRKALAVPANNATGTIKDVEHIVVLMQENRSFDHCFGTLRGVRGFGDPRPINLPGGQPVWYQPDGVGHVLPFHPDASDLGLQFLRDLDHSWGPTHAAWNGGKYDAWVPNKTAATMAYYTREDIPFHFALADAFTICDDYHCSLLGPTDPNRYYMWTGWVGNDGSGGGPVIDNAEAGYSWHTYPERLEAAGISWKIYQDRGIGLDAAGSWGYTDDAYIGNYGDNSLLYFEQYRNAEPGSALYDKARTGTDIMAGDDPFALLRADIAAGTLPAVSWIVAPEAYCEHPNWPPNYGAGYVAEVIDALTANPDVWSKTALFITYDENDGFFDHVVPPCAPVSRDNGLSSVDTANEIFPGNLDNASGPYGLGVRVPMLVVSPWSKGGYVCSQVFDHTSIIRFIEARYADEFPDLIETNISAWRRAVCGDLTTAFNFVDPDADLPTLPPTDGYTPPDHDRHDDYDPQVPSTQSLPLQEPGTRRARALPYDFAASGRIDADDGRYWLDFVNDGAVGAVFHVYSSNRGDGPWTYTAGAGTTVSDYWSAVAVTGGVYSLDAYGANGFLRSFGGDIHLATADGGANPEVAATYDPTNDALIVHLGNNGSGACALTISANRYSDAAAQTVALAAGATLDIAWPLAASAHWYDFSIVSDHDAHYLRRLAGHVETGAPSLSDPAFGTGADRIFGGGFD